MDSDDRMYQVYCDIARVALHRTPIPRECWDAIPRRSLMRSGFKPDDGQVDHDKELEGDAQ